MDRKQAQEELTDIAHGMSGLPGALGLSSQVLASALHLAELGDPSDPEDESPEQAAVAILDAELEALPKKRAWWSPPRNFLINQGLSAYNFYRFTILPMYAARMAYNEALGGIVIHPIWTPLNNDYIRSLDVAAATKLVAIARKSATIQEDVRQELAWIERTFKIDIPDKIKATLTKDALTTAKRRWGVDRLKTKNRLIPLDGSPARDL